MPTTVDYFFSLISPYTYMGHDRFEALAARKGVEVSYKPANIGKVFAVSGGLPVPQRAPQRQAYRFMELKRWRDHLNIPLNLEPKHFPTSDSQAGRVVLALLDAGQQPGPFMSAVLRAVWAEERDVGDPATLAAILKAGGHDPEPLLASAEGDEVVAAQEACTQEAIDRGVFGAPTWIVGEELFWGQDRLDFLERALGG